MTPPSWPGAPSRAPSSPGRNEAARRERRAAVGARPPPSEEPEAFDLGAASREAVIKRAKPCSSAPACSWS